MKLVIAFLAIVITLGVSACSTTASKDVTLQACCSSNEPDKTVTLQDSWAPGGRVVRLAH